MLVTGKETNMPVDLIYGSPNSRRRLHNYDCYCNYVEDLRNSLIDAYFRTIYWHTLTAMQTLSSGCTGPFVVNEKVSVVDYRIQMNPTGPSKVEHVDQLILIETFQHI